MRYVPDRDFPSYTYVPGRNEHPHRHRPGLPDGLSKTINVCESSTPSRDLFLWGIDLFNGGYYWESHEAWEEIWIETGRQGDTADYLKGLIKLAAAGVKAYAGESHGAERHLRRGIELLSHVCNSPILVSPEFLLEVPCWPQFFKELRVALSRLPAGNPPVAGYLTTLVPIDRA